MIFKRILAMFLGADPLSIGQARNETTGSHDRETPEVSIWLEEYRALRAEIVSRLEAQQQLQNYSVVLLGAALPVGATFVAEGNHYFLLLVPPFFAFLGLLFLAQDRMIRMLGLYLNAVVAPSLDRLLAERWTSGSSALLGWELFQYTENYVNLRARFTFFTLGVAKYILPLAPGVIALLLYLALEPAAGMKPEELLLFSVDTIGLALLTLFALVLSRHSFGAMRQRRLEVSAAGAEHPPLAAPEPRSTQSSDS